MSEQFLSAICLAVTVAFCGGLAVGLMWRAFRENERYSTDRFPPPGTQPKRPVGFKPFRRSPDMLTDESKNP